MYGLAHMSYNQPITTIFRFIGLERILIIVAIELGLPYIFRGKEKQHSFAHSMHKGKENGTSPTPSLAIPIFSAIPYSGAR
jgi:energy-converting hydrogenase Eha subunit A